MSNLLKRPLYRSRTNRKLAGVAGGLADYFGIDPTLMRLIWVVAAILGHVMVVVAYLVLWLVVPVERTPGGIIDG